MVFKNPYWMFAWWALTRNDLGSSKSYQWIVLLLIILNTEVTYSQTDAHYWTYQYGAKGLLLNGAVIASPDDETSIYYNPGAIGKSDDLGFAFSFLTPTYSSSLTSNLLGDEKSYNFSDLSLSPGFLAIRFRPFSTKAITFGIASFQRLSTKLKYTDRSVRYSDDIVPDIFRGDFDFGRNVSQSWHGIGISWNITDQIGFGVTQYSVWHSEDLTVDIKRELFTTQAPYALTVGLRSSVNYKFSIKSAFLTKLGIAYHSEDMNLGITYTSTLYGGIDRNASYSFDFLTREDRRQTQVVSNRPEIDLRDFKTPMSIGFGAEYIYDDWRIAFSAEYYEGIPAYDVINDIDDPFDGLLANPSEETFVISYTNKSVINFALGFQKKLNDRTSLLWGFRTDFNQGNNFNLDNKLNFTSTNPDVFHVSGGGLLTTKSNIISLGFDYGFGLRKNGRQIIDNTIVTRQNLLELGTKNKARTVFHSIMLFLTYDFVLSRFEKASDR